MHSMLVNGMRCNHCKEAVEKAVNAIPGVKNAQVDLAQKRLSWDEDDKNQPVAINIISDAISDLGFEPESHES